MKKLIMGMVLLIISSSVSGCATLMGESFGSGDKGRILISADTAGMRAFGDIFTGAITTGKASPDVDTPHHQMRREQEITKRFKYQVVAPLRDRQQGEK